jgi:hypothetical protein
MVRYLLVVYGLGGAWVWWLAVARGTTRLVMGIVLLAATAGWLRWCGCERAYWARVESAPRGRLTGVAARILPLARSPAGGFR